jgi:hypothetical protein
MSALFWLAAGSSLVVALGLAAFAPAIAWFVGDARLIALTHAFALLVVIGGVQSPYSLESRSRGTSSMGARAQTWRCPGGLGPRTA